jgi:hypothetical protein
METTTIVAVHGAREWQAADGATNYQIEITLEDGRSGNVTAKSPDRWKEGDVVVIKRESQNKYGYQWSLDKPMQARPQPNTSFLQAPRSGQNASDRTDIIEASWAIHMAILHSQQTDSKVPVSPNDLPEYALRLLQARDKLVKLVKEQQPET